MWLCSDSLISWSTTTSTEHLLFIWYLLHLWTHGSQYTVLCFTVLYKMLVYFLSTLIWIMNNSEESCMSACIKLFGIFLPLFLNSTLLHFCTMMHPLCSSLIMLVPLSIGFGWIIMVQHLLNIAYICFQTDNGPIFNVNFAFCAEFYLVGNVCSNIMQIKNMKHAKALQCNCNDFY